MWVTLLLSGATARFIPTEPIGEIPCPDFLITGAEQVRSGQITAAEYSSLTERAVRETIGSFETTGSLVIMDGAGDALLTSIASICPGHMTLIERGGDAAAP